MEIGPQSMEDIIYVHLSYKEALFSCSNKLLVFMEMHSFPDTPPKIFKINIGNNWVEFSRYYRGLFFKSFFYLYSKYKQLIFVVVSVEAEMGSHHQTVASCRWVLKPVCLKILITTNFVNTGTGCNRKFIKHRPHWIYRVFK